MIAETGAKNGARCPQPWVAISQATAAANAAWTITRQRTCRRWRRPRMEIRAAASSSIGVVRSRSTPAILSGQVAAVAHRLEVEQRLRERRAVQPPALTLVERAGPGLAGRCVELHRPVALAGGLGGGQPVQAGGEAGPPPRW